MWQGVCIQRLEKEVRSPGAVVTGSCESPKFGTEYGTWVLCKTSGPLNL